MTDDLMTPSPSPIPSLNLGENGPVLVFLHANGYPPECYRPLLELLARDYRVSAMLQRPLWEGSNPDELVDWRPLTGDLLRFLDARFTEPVIGVGHSMGGIALLRAALNEPRKFSAIVLVDPVLFPPNFIRFWRLVRTLGLGYRFHPLVQAARRRRRQFNDLERLFNGYRRKSVFKYMDEQALRAYVQGIACQAEEGGYRLCYSVEWETRIYVTGLSPDLELWRGFPRMATPSLIIRGAHTDTFQAATARLVKRIQPKIRLETVEEASHLVPLERPAQVHALIRSFLEENA
jgi:pimeloyl-ACP methyl ester carboxylesterase